MRTHRRAWMVRVGIIASVALAGLFGLAAPAMAENPTVTITSLSSGSLAVGESATLKFTVKNNNKAPAGETSANIAISFSGFQQDEVSCSGSCNFTQAIDYGATAPEFTATIKAGTVQAGQTRNGQIHIKVSIGNGNNADVPRDLSIKGAAAPPPAQTQTVPEVSGTVVDVYTGTGVEGAKVSIQDSAATTWEVGTDKSGNFKIVNAPDKQIKPGIMSFTVTKDGLGPFPGLTKQANANQALGGVRLTVTPLASATASADPNAGAATGGVTQNVSSLATDVAGPAANGSGGGLSGILIAVGAVLVALGVGAIVLLFVRKKNEGDDPDGQDPKDPRKGGPPQMGPPGPRGPRPPQRRGAEMPPPMRGAPNYDPTRQMRPPVSPGPRGDQTMISPSPLANAPTQLHRAVPAEHDPYAAPPPRHNGGPPGYGPGPGGQSGPGPYGAAGGGYGQPTQGGNPTTPYPGGAPSYGQGPDQYGQPGYGQAYGQGPTTDPYAAPPSYGQGTEPYGQPGYDQPGYGQEGRGPAHSNGYDPRAEPRDRDPRGQRPAPPPQQDPRRVDWLDD